MASSISAPERPAVTLDDLGRAIERRKDETGVTDLPRNSGNRRTASKRALLEAIAAAGGRW